MIFVYQFRQEQDPGILSKVLWQQKIPHRIFNKDGSNQLWLLDERHLSMTQQILNMYLGEPDKLAQVIPNNASSHSFAKKSLLQFRLYPISFTLILMSLLVALITGLGSEYATLSWFSFLPIEVRGAYLATTDFAYLLENNQYWRLITPIFLHFSVMHIAFNLLWVWDIGRKVEQIMGSSLYLGFVLLTALASNSLQYWDLNTPLFGGMSGVVYAVIGFAWLIAKLIPNCPILISKPIMVFLMLWLALGYTSVLEQIGIGKMANTAHLVGLICGLVAAYLYYFYRQGQRR